MPLDVKDCEDTPKKLVPTFGKKKMGTPVANSTKLASSMGAPQADRLSTEDEKLNSVSAIINDVSEADKASQNKFEGNEMLEMGKEIATSTEVAESTSKIEEGDDDKTKTADKIEDIKSSTEATAFKQDPPKSPVRDGEKEAGPSTDQADFTCHSKEQEIKLSSLQPKGSESDVHQESREASDFSKQSLEQHSVTKHVDQMGGDKSQLLGNVDQADKLTGGEENLDHHDKMITEADQPDPKDELENVSDPTPTRLIEGSKRGYEIPGESESQIKNNADPPTLLVPEIRISDDSTNVKDEKSHETISGEAQSSIDKVRAESTLDQGTDDNPMSEVCEGTDDKDSIMHEQSKDEMEKTEISDNGLSSGSGASNDMSTAGPEGSQGRCGDKGEEDVVKGGEKIDDEEQIMVYNGSGGGGGVSGGDVSGGGVSGGGGGKESSNKYGNEAVKSMSEPKLEVSSPDDINCRMQTLSAQIDEGTKDAADTQVKNAPDVLAGQKGEQVKATPADEDGDAGNMTGGQDKIPEADEVHPGEVVAKDITGEISPENELQDDDLMDFTYSQVCQMEEQCLATEAKKMKSDEVSSNQQKSTSAKNPSNVNFIQPSNIHTSQNSQLAGGRQSVPIAAAVAIPSPCLEEKSTGVYLPCGPSSTLRSEDIEAANVVNGIIVELRGLNQMIMGAKKQIEAVRRQRQVKQKQQQQQQQQQLHPAKRQMRQQKLLPSGPRQMGYHPQHRLQSHQNAPYDGNKTSKAFPAEQ
ncbi:uncharacterized protein [Amphiura filiformis]|uniref:uncharacterized protein n=1 Tax=Amphiura filiformis TaxID=82378 RepID=UPI003B221916